MKRSYKKVLYIFRRDLRLNDNTALLEALSRSTLVIPCFIFDPRQFTSENDYRSMNAIQFMLESLDDLEKQLKKQKGKLYRFYGLAEKVIEQLLRDERIEAIFVNRDYTPFSIQRDKKIRSYCAQQDIDFISTNDLLLTQPGEVETTAGTSYKIFTPFYRRASKLSVAKPTTLQGGSFYTDKVTIEAVGKKYKKPFGYNNPNLHVQGGRSSALKILKDITTFKNYAKTRDFPDKSTTNLSAYLKFGCVSIREVYSTIYQKLGSKHPLIRQLYWRDFFTHVAYNFPVVFEGTFYKKYKKLKWSNSQTKFAAWCAGKTGFPIVDAGMRQLNETGFMHNRVRMIAGSFLVKDLHINWQKGEKYFAQKLVDYDPSVNNGNWQWVASTGTDSQPYFRIFNPWLQQKKFDPECIYIKRWVAELKEVDPKEIHKLYKIHAEIENYPEPIVDHRKQANIAKQIYKKIAQSDL